jgi:hypothetical protein
LPKGQPDNAKVKVKPLDMGGNSMDSKKDTFKMPKFDSI